MIVSNRKYLFGAGYVGVVHNQTFNCVVTTALEGVAKGFSAVIQTFEGRWGAHRNLRLVAKAMFQPSLSKAQCRAVHDAILAHLDDLGSCGTTLGEAIDRAFAQATERNLIVDYVSDLTLAKRAESDPSAASNSETSAEAELRTAAGVLGLTAQEERGAQELREVTLKAWVTFLKTAAGSMGYAWPVDIDAISKLARETTDPAARWVKMSQVTILWEMTRVAEGRKLQQSVAETARKFAVAMIRTLCGTLDDLPSNFADAVTDAYVGCFVAHHDFAFGTEWLSTLSLANKRGEDREAFDGVLASMRAEVDRIWLASALVRSYRDTRLTAELQRAADFTVLPRMQGMLLGDHAPHAGSYRLIKASQWWQPPPVAEPSPMPSAPAPAPSSLANPSAPPLLSSSPMPGGFLAGDKASDQARLMLRRMALNPDADEVYQFNCRGCNGSTTTVRLIRRVEQVICVSYMRHGFEPERLDAKPLPASDWHRLKAKLDQTDFWHLAEHELHAGLDGEDWEVEGRWRRIGPLFEDEYRCIKRWTPHKGPFFDLGCLFVELAGVEMPNDVP